MPFVNVKVPRGALSSTQKKEIIERTTAMFVDVLGASAGPATLVLIEDVPDGGYGRGGEVLTIPSDNPLVVRGD